MTSVQNPPLQLSGSKWFLVGLLFLLIAGQSCHLIFPDRVAPDPSEDPIVIDADTLPEPEPDTLDVLFPEQYPDTINVAYILPFFFDREEGNGVEQRLQEISLNLYQGSRVALDTLEACGYHVNVHVFDSRNDTNRLNSIKPELLDKDIHLSIGPLFQQHTLYLADFARENRLNIVSPLANVEGCPANNPYLFYSNPSVKDFGKAAAGLANRDPGITPVIIRRDNEEEARMADYFIEHLDLFVMDSIREFVYSGNEWQQEELEAKELGKANFVFIPSRNEPFVTTMFTHLQSAGSEYVVAGPAQWQHFSRIDGGLWRRYNVHLIGGYYVDYGSPSAITFVEKFRDAYHTEPGEFAFRGFDETLMYVNQIRQDGVYFQRKMFEEPPYEAEPIMQPVTGLHKTYDFSGNTCNAWINQYIHILRYQNHRLKKVD